MGEVGVGALLSLSGIGREVGWGGLLFEAGRLLTFSAFRMGVYSRWALIRGRALIRINTVISTMMIVQNVTVSIKNGRFYKKFLLAGRD